MILVKCILIVFLGSERVPLQVDAVLIDRSGDSWLVDFGAYLQAHPEYTYTTQVQRVNGNNCLVMKGRLSYGR
jgi:hypothetical protein